MGSVKNEKSFSKNANIDLILFSFTHLIPKKNEHQKIISDEISHKKSRSLISNECWEREKSILMLLKC